MTDHFAGRLAAGYDQGSPEMFDPARLGPTVDFLAAYARGGALEFGIGTGRVALPLSARGVRVVGIDLSPDMVDQLRPKPGADAIDVVIGDFATTKVDGAFSLVYLVFNAIMNLTTQDEQVACFRNAAAHLQPGGHFVVEVIVPDLQRLPPGETVKPFLFTSTHVGIDEYDVVHQGLVSHHYFFADELVGSWSMPARYVWPAELDLMARLAGMTLQERWGSWTREPFTAGSRSHVSVYRLDGSAGI